MSRGTNISQPQELILQVPRPQVDYNGRPIRVEDYELDRQTLRAALTTMANYIGDQRQEITIITVGGKVITMLLRTRESTHDVDFFGTNLNNSQRVLLDEAANQTMSWLPPDVHRTITREALDQNQIFFHKRGLKVVAAPSNYALCGKMKRLVPARSKSSFI
ncbi:MAG: hypothetical protein Q9178_001765 [Gyalolechia marmorata]